MKKILHPRAKLCYMLAVILSAISVVLLVMLVFGQVPEFMISPVDWVIQFFPKDNDLLLLLCFFGMIISLVLIPGLLILGFIKLGHYLEKKSWKVRRQRPIITL